MADLNGFDANALPEDPLVRSYELLPDGPLEVIASASEMRESKSGNATYLEVELEVVGGDHRGRRLWDRFMMTHQTSEKAVEIGVVGVGGLDVPVPGQTLHVRRGGAGLDEVRAERRPQRVEVDHLARRVRNRPTPVATRSRLASLCRAVGNPAPGDSSDLHGVPVTAIVGRETRKDTGEEVNRVKAYRPLETPSRGGRPSGSPRRPWER